MSIEGLIFVYPLSMGCRMEGTRQHAAATIVLVEDEDMVRRLVSRVLEMEGYRVVEATSGEEGLEILEGEEADLLLTDITLPGRVNGIELGRKALAEHRDLKLICMSGSTEDEMDEDLRARAAGATAFLGKPFSPSQLVETVHWLLDAA